MSRYAFADALKTAITTDPTHRHVALRLKNTWLPKDGGQVLASIVTVVNLSVEFVLKENNVMIDLSDITKSKYNVA